MMKKMVAAALGLALGLFVPSLASAAARAPKHSGGIVFEDPSFIGLNKAYIDKSVTSSQLVTGSGLLYAICPDGGTLGKYTVAYDYTLSEGANFPTNPFTTSLIDTGNPFKYAISPIVGTRVLTTDWLSAAFPNETCWTPVWPVRFELGLIGANNDTGHRALFLYRLDTGANP